MNLRGIIPLKVNQLYVGQWVYLSEENAEIFATPYSQVDPDYVLPHGIYIVSRIIPRSPNPNLPAKLQTIADVVVHHLGWDPSKRGLHIVYNVNSEAITINSSILISDVLFPVFRNRKDFDKANSGQFTCVSCGRNLNILGVNLRICSACEEILDRPPSKKVE